MVFGLVLWGLHDENYEDPDMKDTFSEEVPGVIRSYPDQIKVRALLFLDIYLTPNK